MFRDQGLKIQKIPLESAFSYCILVPTFKKFRGAPPPNPLAPAGALPRNPLGLRPKPPAACQRRRFAPPSAGTFASNMDRLQALCSFIQACDLDTWPKSLA